MLLYVHVGISTVSSNWFRQHIVFNEFKRLYLFITLTCIVCLVGWDIQNIFFFFRFLLHTYLGLAHFVANWDFGWNIWQWNIYYAIHEVKFELDLDFRFFFFRLVFFHLVFKHFVFYKTEKNVDGFWKMTIFVDDKTMMTDHIKCNRICIWEKKWLQIF